MVVNPLISICMPVYNAAPYLAEAVEGVLKQTYSHLELVITDNCSTDGSAQLAQQYAANDLRVRFYQNAWNVGYAGNAHKCTSLAHGDFILMHGADDYLLPHALERYVQVMHHTNSGHGKLVLMSDFYRGDARGNLESILGLDSAELGLTQYPLDREPVIDDEFIKISGRDALVKRFPKLLSFGGVGSTLVSRKLYESCEGYLSNHWFNPDKFFIYKVLSLDPEVLWVREPLYYYRIHPTNQLSVQAGSGVLRQLLDQYAYTYEFDKEFYACYGQGQDTIVKRFVEFDCLNAALRELAIGSRRMGFRQMCFALATYPNLALRSVKTYLAFLIWLGGPLGRTIASLAYKNFNQDR